MLKTDGCLFGISNSSMQLSQYLKIKKLRKSLEKVRDTLLIDLYLQPVGIIVIMRPNNTNCCRQLASSLNYYFPSYCYLLEKFCNLKRIATWCNLCWGKPFSYRVFSLLFHILKCEDVFVISVSCTPNFPLLKSSGFANSSDHAVLSFLLFRLQTAFHRFHITMGLFINYECMSVR